MRNHDTRDRRGPGRAGGRLARWALVLAFMVPAAGCDILDVDNPNNLTQDDVADASAATALVNGARATVTRGIGEMAASYASASDELTWIGSRDAWDQLDDGNLNDPANEFVDAAFPFLAEGRWMADEAIDVVGGHVADESTAAMRENLARAYLWGGVIYTHIGDMMEDFAFSDRDEAGSAVGPGNMNTVYQTAIDYLGEAISIAQADGLAEIEDRATAMRARAAHGMAVWGVIHGGGGPYVSAGTGDAQTIVTAMGTAPWEFQAVFSSATVASNIAFQVNERGELQLGEDYVTRNADDSIDEFILLDPVSGSVDDRFVSEANAFLGGGQYSPITLASNREMHLILAEDEFAASGNSAQFRTYINNVRVDIGGADPFTATDDASGEEILQHERRVNLYLQNRRLADHYRFDTPSAEWLVGAAALSNPGLMLPITCIEVRANPNISTAGC